MLSHHDLAPLRLSTLLPPDMEVVEHGSWEWMGREWLYEGIGFTWFGRLKEAPSKTVAFELSLAELSVEQLAALCGPLRLQIRHGMPLSMLTDLFGAPIGERQFVSDRRSFDFRIISDGAYLVTATIHADMGLIHLSAISDSLA